MKDNWNIASGGVMPAVSVCVRLKPDTDHCRVHSGVSCSLQSTLAQHATLASSSRLLFFAINGAVRL